ncbi:MAG: nicotinamide-nucleotide adenylyltransferase [Nitrososphaeraceae archaeon]
MIRKKNIESSNCGLMIGRFQPFHKGHLELASQIYKENKKVIIVIGSAQFNYIYKDPFTAGERIRMIHETILETKDLDISKFHIIPISNIENNSCWFSNLRSWVPHFNTLYSGNEFVINLLKKENIQVKKPNFKNKKKYNGENIRKLIINNGKWEHLVPSAVKKIILEIEGIERIKVVANSDSLPHKW